MVFQRIFIVMFLSYLVIFTSGIFYSFVLDNQLAWPVLFMLFYFLSPRVKMNKPLTSFLKNTTFFIILYFVFGYFSAVLVSNSILDERLLIRNLIKIITCTILVPIITFRVIQRHGLYKIYKVLLYLTFVSILLQIYQFLNPQFFINFLLVDQENYRPGGFFTNPNVSAFFYLFVAILHANLMRQKRNYILLVLFLGFLLTFSRSGLFAYLIFLLIYFWLYSRKAFYKVFIGLLIFSPIVFFILNTASELNQFQRIVNIDQEVIKESRTGLWLYAIEKVSQNSVIFGSGLQTMDHVIDFKGRNGLGPHNLFIYVWGTAGIIPFFLMLRILYKFLLVRDNLDKILGIGIKLFLIITLMLNHDLLKVPIFWLIISIFIYIKQFHNEQKAKNSPSH